MKVYGKFTKKDDLYYRTDTYLQIGESEEVLGGFVFLNPGMGSLKNENILTFLENGESATGEMEWDFSMDQIKKILDVIEKGEEGRVYLFNLFTLTDNPNYNFKEIVDEKTYDMNLMYSDFHKVLEIYEDIPYLILAWGCDRDSSLYKEKVKWIYTLEDKDMFYVGVEGNENINYYSVLSKNSDRDITKSIEEAFLMKI